MIYVSGTRTLSRFQKAFQRFQTSLEQGNTDSLADFSVYTSPKPAEKDTAKATNNPGEGAESSSGKSREDDLVRSLLGGAFSDDGAGGDNFEEHLKSMLKDDPVAMAEFEKLTAASSGTESSESQKNFADTLAETLTSLSANAESLKSDLSEDELMKSFQESLNLGPDADGAAASGDFIPMMQNMMSNLLSKDILYPSLKDLADKYPAWLSANNGKLPKKQFDLYAKQFDIVSKLCDCYDSERETDSREVKDERFEQLLELMSEMQECGPPPKEIVGELVPGLNFDAAGNPVLPGMEQCSIM